MAEDRSPVAVKTPAAPAPDEDAAPPVPLAPLEPLIGLREFVAMRQLKAPLLAAFRAWMALQGHDADGHYTLAQWDDYLAQTRRHR